MYRASGKNVLYGDDGADGFSIGQILLLPKPLLEKRVLSDERIELYDCGRDDVRSGQVDRRVLATLAYLAESGLRPTVTSLKCGHGYYTAPGTSPTTPPATRSTSPRSTASRSSATKTPAESQNKPSNACCASRAQSPPTRSSRCWRWAAKRSPWPTTPTTSTSASGPSLATNNKLGKQALAVLKPGQWSNLIDQLRKIDNPTVPTKPSKYAIPVKKNRRSSDAHQGE